MTAVAADCITDTLQLIAMTSGAIGEIGGGQGRRRMGREPAGRVGIGITGGIRTTVRTGIQKYDRNKQDETCQFTHSSSPYLHV